jgi:hypothetical protein
MSIVRRRLNDADVLSNYTSGLGRRAVPPRVVQAVDRGVAVEHGRGIVVAARVRAVEHVADEAMHATGRLSQSEAFWTRHAPHGAARYQAIADLTAMALADIVADMGRQ